MPVYGIFNPGEKEPELTFEGDSMVENEGFIVVFREKEGSEKLQSAIRLEKGQIVEEIPQKSV